MKILVVNDLLQGGGVEKLMYDIVMRYHTAHQITILTDKRDRDFDKIYPADVNYLYQMEEDYPEATSWRIKQKNRFLRKSREIALKKKIKEMNFDVLLCVKESWIMMMALTYGDYIPRKLAWVHTDYRKSYYTKYWYGSEANEVSFMKRFNHVICVSKVIEDSLKEVIGDPGNLLVRYNPVDADYIIHQGLIPIEGVTRKSRPLFVTVGRLNYQKGFDILLEVCNLLNIEGYQYDVWIVGGGEAFDNYGVQHDLENMIYKYNLTNVYLLGPQTNPHQFVKQADWFLSSSRYEGYSYVSQEAAIQNVPLMLTDCSGVEELMDLVESGVVMENSFTGIYLGMRDAILNPDKSKEYANKMQRKGNDFYWDDRWKAIEELFL